MAEHLFVRFGDEVDQATIVALNADGHLLSRPEVVPLAAIPGRAEGMQLTVLLPARDVVTTQAQVPAVSPAKLRQLLPYSLEDEFASDIEQLHFAAGERNDAELVAVSVIARDRLEFWLGVLRTAGISASRICSEADAVPDTPGVVSLFVEGSSILGRRPGGAPFSFDELTLDEVWALLAQEQDDADDLNEVVLFTDPETRADRAAEIEAWQGGLEQLNLIELADGCLPRLAGGLLHRKGADLLQGEFAPRSNIGAMVRPWRVAAGFAIALLALSVLGKGAEVWKLNQNDTELTAAATEICAADFASRQLSRCRAEMQRRLAANNQSVSSGGEGFLSTLAAIAEAGGDALAIEGINYRGDVLSLEVIVPSIAYLDTLGQQLRDTGRFQLEVQSTSPQGARVDARLQIVAVAQ